MIKMDRYKSVASRLSSPLCPALFPRAPVFRCNDDASPSMARTCDHDMGGHAVSKIAPDQGLYSIRLWLTCWKPRITISMAALARLKIHWPPSRKSKNTRGPTYHEPGPPEKNTIMATRFSNFQKQQYTQHVPRPHARRGIPIAIRSLPPLYFLIRTCLPTHYVAGARE